MPEITLRNITKRWGKFYAVDHLDLDIPNNSFITLLGPSGCGKTTILRMIAGLETPTEGQIKIGDRVVFDSAAGINVPANKRKVGFLFQNYALWPNMTVYQNISFGLSNIKEPLPKYDFEAMKAGELARALQSGKRIKELADECRDKNGKIDAERFHLKLIDAFTLSLFTAKTLAELKIHEAADPDALAGQKADEFSKQEAALRESHAAKGESLDENYAVLRDGKPVLEDRKLTKEEIDKTVRRVSRIVKIGMFMDRYPAELSGGQQQRVAIARTLAPEPSVLFMDEPLSNLDAKLRLEMRYELQRLHLETGSTFVYVTHDQMEAMTLATKICLINNGVLQQHDAPLDVYNRPNNTFAADFVGNPSINFVEAKGRQQENGDFSFNVLDGFSVTFRPDSPVDLAGWRAKRDSDKQELVSRMEKYAVEKGNKDEAFKYHVAKVDETDYAVEEEPEITDEDFILGIRPEFIQLSKDGKIPATVYGAMPTGMESTVKLRVGQYLLTGVIFGNTTFTIGEETGITIKGSVLLFDRRSGKIITTGTLLA